MILIIKCNICKCKIFESSPHISIDKENYCGECAFKSGMINEKEYLKWFVFYISIDNLKAGINPNTNEIEITTNRKFSWEKTDRDHRQSSEYIKWRSNVFTRDNFKCAICGQVGGDLEAHHIKPFARYTGSRFSVKNGVTLCKKCHKRVHKEKDNEWLHIT